MSFFFIPSRSLGLQILIMNNFAENPQIEAPDQDFSLPTSQFDSLSNITVTGRGKCPVAFADVRYSNGADAAFTQWLLQFGPELLPLASVAYAGWNTGQFLFYAFCFSVVRLFTLGLAGNSLGTAVANVVLLAALREKVQTSAADFTVLRLLEDWHYQSVVRQLLKKYSPCFRTHHNV
jgi:hypothetical protein